MAADQRDMLEVLRFELYLLEQGAYRGVTSRSRAPLSYFQDSPTCINFGETANRRSCRECLLSEFIPGRFQNETTACERMPLDDAGTTVRSLQRGYNRVAVEQAVLGWLRDTVARIERERRRELVACP